MADSGNSRIVVLLERKVHCHLCWNCLELVQNKSRVESVRTGSWVCFCFFFSSQAALLQKHAKQFLIPEIVTAGLDNFRLSPIIEFSVAIP